MHTPQPRRCRPCRVKLLVEQAVSAVLGYDAVVDGTVSWLEQLLGFVLKAGEVLVGIGIASRSSK